MKRIVLFFMCFLVFLLTVNANVFAHEKEAFESFKEASRDFINNGDGTYTFVMPAQAITIVATATRAQHNVSFVSNDGSAVDGQVILNGEVAVKPDAPVRAGYAFAGWYKDNTFTQKYDFSTPVEGEITLYARWFMWGDVNLDGKVNGVDAMRIQQYLMLLEYYKQPYMFLHHRHLLIHK